jgi:transcriptional regulator with XRE-family HTH domain
MRTCNLHFPGLDEQTSEKLAADVAADQEAVLTAIRNLREEAGISLEALGFVLGCDAAHLSRYLKGMSVATLTQYIRVPRALGYRCTVNYERVDRTSAGNATGSELAILHHKVLSPRAVTTRRR